MSDASKWLWRGGRTLWPALLAGTLLIAWAGRSLRRPPTPPLDSWDIPCLVAHLNDHGLGLRMVSTMKSGVNCQSAYLTSTGKSWEDLSHLLKDPQRIHHWKGTLYCERGPVGDWNDLARQWGDCCLVVGPFLFFGDRDLLARVRAVLGSGRAGRTAAAGVGEGGGIREGVRAAGRSGGRGDGC